jgi:predicted kinase
MPLLIVSGASGTGKSTVCNNLTGRFHDAVILDCDILWREEFNKPENDYREFFETWLRVCKRISQSGRPVVLFGAGVGVPANLENCVEHRYFSEIRYLALVCSDEVLSERLMSRPAWRDTRNQAYIQDHQRFNQWFKDYNKNNDQPPISILDTSNSSVEETTRGVEDWIRGNL